ncbi:MAG TPA: ABC transporter ATP-binding protein [Methylomirabilota bacterium]|nr:ABC transporter ATP-binding protein [Methylomirabilota bacterium]
MTEPILEVTNLVKVYGSSRVVDGISFSVPRGKIVGFLGPNGAGKTTTIHMLLGITSPTVGSISFFGKDFFKHKQAILQRINFASAFNTLQGRITVRENLVVFAQLYGIKNPKKKIAEFISYFEIEEILTQRYMDLSAGQKTRVNIIKALLNDPEIILMDEPTASLDPDIADKTLSYIEQLKKERNLTLLYTSHNMNEITRICDEVIFLDHGKIVAHDTPLGLTRLIKETELRLVISHGAELLEKYLREQTYTFSFHDKTRVSITVEEKQVPQLLFALSKQGIEITDIEINKPTLEDVFLHIARGGNA